MPRVCGCGVQSVLSVILGGDRQWIAPVFTVTGVVVLRTLLQVGAAPRRAVPCCAVALKAALVIPVWASRLLCNLVLVSAV